MNNHKNKTLCISLCLCTSLVMFLSALAKPARRARIRDVARLKNDQPNELIGMGLVVGLSGTGDGGNYLPAMRPLREMMKHFDNPVVDIDKELKNANNVAIVTLSMQIPPQGRTKASVYRLKCRRSVRQRA